MRIRQNVACLLLVVAAFCFTGSRLQAEETWQNALSQMLLTANVAELNRTNCVHIMLGSFQSNASVKAFVFMPGATDEFYMFRRAKAHLAKEKPSLLDAVSALTNQTLIRVTFRRPLLLLHTDEDPLEALIRLEHRPTVEKLQKRAFRPHVVYDDRDWNFVQPILKKALHIDVQPWRHSYDSWHFYRHSFAGWGLSGWEALEAIALAGKTMFTIQRGRIVFEGDERVRATPTLEQFPK